MQYETYCTQNTYTHTQTSSDLSPSLSQYIYIYICVCVFSNKNMQQVRFPRQMKSLLKEGRQKKEKIGGHNKEYVV